jgi:hypothetical protein
MPIVREVVVDCHIDDVFAYLADPVWLADERSEVRGRPPDRIAWREHVGAVTCELEAVWTSTRVTHRDGAALGLLRGRSRARAVQRRLRALKQELERGDRRR